MHEEYRRLRQDFFNIAEPFIDSNVLDQLKRNYTNDIDSKRKLSKVKDLESFIRLLEKRDIISYDNIEQLRFISKEFIRKPDLESRLMDYENWLQTVPQLVFYDMYQSDHTSAQQEGNITQKQTVISEPNVMYNSLHNVSQSFEDQIASSSHTTQELYCLSHPKEENERCNPSCKKKSLKIAVLLQISERLGRSWRDVGRHLGIRECEIEAIQCKHPYDLKEQSYEVLKMYILQSDNDQWTINLMRALEKGRRKDLKELVEELILNRKDI